jgi:hypothetical protein
MFSALKSSFNAVAGIDKLPAGAGDKSFYELKAELPGGKVLDFVST